jgi:dUTP pyrophosphatase
MPPVAPGVPSIKVKKLRPEARLPAYMTPGAAGADLYAAVLEPVRLGPGERAVIPIGIALEIPDGFEGQVRPRSGLAVRDGLTVLNAPGTIDADYRGEVNVIVVNLGQKECWVRTGDRIAQLVVAPVARAAMQWTEALGETDRGAGGFGHTG